MWLLDIHLLSFSFYDVSTREQGAVGCFKTLRPQVQGPSDG